MLENSVVDGLELPVPLEPVGADPGGGAPAAGDRLLGTFGGIAVGVWEVTPGTVEDVEEDEVFVVLAGAATLRFLRTGSEQELRPGSVCRLTAGTRTRWTVRETLRKVFLIDGGTPGDGGAEVPRTP